MPSTTPTEKKLIADTMIMEALIILLQGSQVKLVTFLSPQNNAEP